jgi:hypothetical protein
MMRALAEFIMRGRMQAVMVVVISLATALFAWIGVATVALVFLRKGLREGGFVLLWAILPAAVIAKVGMDIGPMATLVAGALGAIALRLTVSWPLSLMTITLSALLLSVLLVTVGDSYLIYIQDLLKPMFAQMSAKQPANEALVVPSATLLAGMLGLSFATVAVCCVLLARGWQSQLYNPGGMRQEMYGLRLPTWQVVLLIVSAAIALQAGSDYRLWALLCVLPLTVAGFALFHGLVGLSKRPTALLFLVYGLWLLSDWFKLLVIVLASLDSVMNFRGRLLESQRSDQN